MLPKCQKSRGLSFRITGAWGKKVPFQVTGRSRGREKLIEGENEPRKQNVEQELGEN